MKTNPRLIKHKIAKHPSRLRPVGPDILKERFEAPELGGDEPPPPELLVVIGMLVETG